MAGCGDEQLIEIGSAKAAGGDFAARHLHAGQLFATDWIPAGDRRTTMQRNPQHALGIDGHAVGHAIPGCWNLDAHRARIDGIALLIQGQSQHLQRRQPQS